jgi:hypothetical protein
VLLLLKSRIIAVSLINLYWTFAPPVAAADNTTGLPNKDDGVGMVVKITADRVGITVKVFTLATVPPPGVVTLILPVVAPIGTVAAIDAALLTVKVIADVPLNFTAVASVKLVPLMVTMVPTTPLVGVKEAMVGAGVGPGEAHRNPLVLSKLSGL